MMTMKTLTKITTIGTLRCDDSNGNETVTNNRFNEQNKTLHVHHAFLYISLPSLHDYNVKMPNCTFYGGRKLVTSDDEIFLLFVNLHMVLRNSTPAEFTYIWQSRYIAIIPIKILTLEFTFKRRFYCRLHPLILSSQMIMINHENTKESTAVSGKKVNSTIKSLH